MAGNHHSTPWRGARVQRAAALALGVSLLLAAASGPALADKVGVAAAVNPDAFSSLSGVPNKQLNIGKSIFYNERINTTASGLVQVLLVDGSTFTVGPNSDLVIDKFVYDPRKKTGELVATFSKGTMRFIGGKLSKNEGGVKVNTPAGALAIRGGMFQGSTSRGVYSFLFGHSLTFRGNNGQTQTVYETGYSLDLSGGNANVRPTTPEDTNAFMQALSSTGTNFGSGGTGTNGPANPTGTQQLTNIENGADQEISDANFVMVQTAIQEQLIRLNNLRNKTPQQGTPTPNGNDGDIITEPVKTEGTFTGYSAGFLQTSLVEGGQGMPEFLLNGQSEVSLDPKGNAITANINTDHVRITDGPEFDPVAWLRDRGLLPHGTPDITLSRETTTLTNYNLGFGGSAENSDFVDDNIFLAIENDGSTKVVQHISTSGEINVGAFEYKRLACCKKFGFLWLPYLETKTSDPFQISLPISNQTDSYEGATHVGDFASIATDPAKGPTELCTKCDFIKYGLWSSEVSYGDNFDILGGWWVAGDIINDVVGELPATGSASYAGSTIATVADFQNQAWNTRIATGKADMTWDFAARAGRFDVTQFDKSAARPNGLNFGGPISMPGNAQNPTNLPNKFTGAFDTNSALAGGVAGSFVRKPGQLPGAIPAGAIGNWQGSADNYRATGVFGVGRK